MRIVTLEEHYVIPDLVSRIDKAAIATRGWPTANQIPSPIGGSPKALAEVGPERLEAMDKGGISVQVLSSAGPGADLMTPDKRPDLARDYNDRLKQLVDRHPDRFAGFAHLPMTAPEAAADELERAVKALGLCGAMINGVTDNRFLDDASFEPILARAVQLDVPLYLHPNLPPPAVRKVYYDGLPGMVGAAGDGMRKRRCKFCGSWSPGWCCFAGMLRCSSPMPNCSRTGFWGRWRRRPRRSAARSLRRSRSPASMSRPPMSWPSWTTSCGRRASSCALPS